MLHKRSLLVVVAALASLASLTGCPGKKLASCQSPIVGHKDGNCSAYYYQSNYSQREAITQALVSCKLEPGNPGGNVVAFNSLAHGIELRWIDAHTLELAVPDGARLEDKRINDTYNGYSLHYVYRSLRQTDPAFSGCGAGP